MLTTMRHLLLCCCMSLTAILVSSPALAEMTKAEASQKAKASHGGKVLSVEKIGSKDGKSIFKVKLLLDGGRVKTVTISD